MVCEDHIPLVEIRSRSAPEYERLIDQSVTFLGFEQGFKHPVVRKNIPWSISRQPTKILERFLDTLLFEQDLNNQKK